MNKGVRMLDHEETLKMIAGVLASYHDSDEASDGELLDMVCELLHGVGLDPFGDTVATNFVGDLRRSAARWNAFIGGTSTSRAQLRELLESFICPSCESAGIQWRVLVNPLTASVVPWDVMGDSRSFAFVCDECAIGSAVVL